jgi:hypothetical protein
MIIVCFLMVIMFIAMVFSVDLSRIQLTRFQLRAVADLSSRAGAEAIARGVGDPNDHNVTDTAIRAEIDMVAQLNSAGGNPVQLDLPSEIEFGYAATNPDGSFEFQPNSGGNFAGSTEGVRVIPSIDDYPMAFGVFVGAGHVDLSIKSSSIVRERDIVVVLDRSTSMLTRDGGSIPINSYNPFLRQLEDDLYNSSDGHYPDTEFVESGSTLDLTRTQALKLAVLKFRQEIDNTRGNEQLGLIVYSDKAIKADDGLIPTGAVDISVNQMNITDRNTAVGDGTTDGNEKYASELESESNSYDNFDFNYAAMRYEDGTNIVDGIKKGTDAVFGNNARAFAVPMVIVMTDGQHNQGGIPQDEATQSMNDHPHLAIYTVTFGSGADQVTMQAVATIGNGQHYHAADVTQLIAIFQSIAREAGVITIE